MAKNSNKIDFDADNIKSSIESGNFFEESKRWYQQKFVMLIHEKTYFLVVTILSIVCVLYSINIVQNFLPLEPNETFTLSFDADMETPGIEFFDIEQNAQNPRTAILMYFAQRYVNMLETYEPSNKFLNKNLGLIKKTTTPQIHTAYYRRLVIEADSLIKQYGQTKRREIFISRITPIYLREQKEEENIFETIQKEFFSPNIDDRKLDYISVLFTPIDVTVSTGERAVNSELQEARLKMQAPAIIVDEETGYATNNSYEVSLVGYQSGNFVPATQ